MFRVSLCEKSSRRQIEDGLTVQLLQPEVRIGEPIEAQIPKSCSHCCNAFISDMSKTSEFGITPVLRLGWLCTACSDHLLPENYDEQREIKENDVILTQDDCEVLVAIYHMWSDVKQLLRHYEDAVASDTVDDLLGMDPMLQWLQVSRYGLIVHMRHQRLKGALRIVMQLQQWKPQGVVDEDLRVLVELLMQRQWDQEAVVIWQMTKFFDDSSKRSHYYYLPAFQLARAYPHNGNFFIRMFGINSEELQCSIFEFLTQQYPLTWLRKHTTIDPTIFKSE